MKEESCSWFPLTECPAGSDTWLSEAEYSMKNETSIETRINQSDKHLEQGNQLYSFITLQHRLQEMVRNLLHIKCENDC